MCFYQQAFRFLTVKILLLEIFFKKAVNSSTKIHIKKSFNNIIKKLIKNYLKTCKKLNFFIYMFLSRNEKFYGNKLVTVCSCQLCITKCFIYKCAERTLRYIYILSSAINKDQRQLFLGEEITRFAHGCDP